MTAATTTRYRFAFDIGGTFTDLVLSGSDGSVRTAKRLSSQDNVAAPIVSGLQDLLRQDDLLGLKEIYNQPGTVSDDNWSLRVPRDYQQKYALAAMRGAALDLPRVLSMALRARGGAASGDRADLADKLMSLPAAPPVVA